MSCYKHHRQAFISSAVHYIGLAKRQATEAAESTAGSPPWLPPTDGWVTSGASATRKLAPVSTENGSYQQEGPPRSNVGWLARHTQTPHNSPSPASNPGQAHTVCPDKCERRAGARCEAFRRGSFLLAATHANRGVSEPSPFFAVCLSPLVVKGPSTPDVEERHRPLREAHFQVRLMDPQVTVDRSLSQAD